MSKPELRAATEPLSFTQVGDRPAHLRTRPALRLGFLLTLGILVVEVAAGLASHSLALLSDAGHILTDATALALAWFAAAQAERPADAHRTFGYHRVGILTALFNGVTLVLVTVGIIYEAYQRFQHPQAVAPGIMIVAAALAIGVNLFIGRRLHITADENLNTRAALLHVLGDVAASAGVIVGAVIIAFTGATWLDPLLSLLIAALIAVSSVRLIREALNILLEATPPGIVLDELVRDMTAVAGVRAVHDLHVWTISSGMRALSCHAVIDDLPPSESTPILDRISALLCEKYQIGHTTIQFESTEHAGHEGFCACPPGTADLYCELHPTESHQHSHAH